MSSRRVSVWILLLLVDVGVDGAGENGIAENGVAEKGAAENGATDNVFVEVGG